jgi:hypothetical protein
MNKVFNFKTNTKSILLMKNYVRYVRNHKDTKEPTKFAILAGLRNSPKIPYVIAYLQKEPDKTYYVYEFEIRGHEIKPC